MMQLDYDCFILAGKRIYYTMLVMNSAARRDYLEERLSDHIQKTG
jgi:hypothetical protein